MRTAMLLLSFHFLTTPISRSPSLRLSGAPHPLLIPPSRRGVGVCPYGPEAAFPIPPSTPPVSFYHILLFGVSTNLG